MVVLSPNSSTFTGGRGRPEILDIAIIKHVAFQAHIDAANNFSFVHYPGYYYPGRLKIREIRSSRSLEEYPKFRSCHRSCSLFSQQMYRTRRRSTTALYANDSAILVRHCSAEFFTRKQALENRRERCQEQHDPVRQEIGLSSRDSTTSRREDSGQEREGMPKSPKARKESSKREREEGRMSEEGLNPFRKSSRTERSPSRGEERNQSKEIEKKIETVLREIKEDMAGIVEESRARRKELAAAREKEGEQEREDMLKSSEVRKESSKREREEGRTSKEGKNPLRNSSRTRRSPNRSEEGNQSKEMDTEMKTTMIREMREEIKTLRKELAAVREENGELRKELATVREETRGREEKGQLEKADWMKRMEMIEEKMEQREKKERKNNVIITGIGEAFKINKDKMILAKIESWEQKKNIMLSKSKLKEKKGERMYIDDDLTKEERETQKQLRELAREERDRGKRVKIGYRKIQINGDWFRWDKRQEKLKKIC
ncbi:hypothetical protein GEV33_007999 [Tenebrio molitor]|uniref:Uncharacterized protein n=1 Tax=Tenebrio molitor TaxID=7067 RepID=A0A8J6LBU2_TENMO|nr:hypothetical protein GEV33_007999 [Tenebrio molitor]